MADRASEGGSFFTSPFNSARVQNRVLEATNYYQSQIAQRQGGGGIAGNDATTVQVKNVTGGALRRGEVLEFTDYGLADDLEPGRFWMIGDEPDLTNVGWGVLLNPLEDDEVGPCRVVGACIAFVDVNDADDKYAAVISGDTVLSSGAGGDVRILYKPTGTGELECVVLIGPTLKVHLGKTDAAIAKDASGTVSRYKGESSAESDTGINDTVKNKFANVAITKWCAYIDIDGTYYMISAEC